MNVIPDAMRGHVAKIMQGEYCPPSCVDITGIKTVLDLGANIGAFTAWALETFPDAHITAVEPMRENCEIFLENIIPTARRRVTFFPAAAWDGTPVIMHSGRNNCGEASMFDLGEQKDDSITVPSIDPEDLPPADFVKLDVEGAEWKILSRLPLANTKIIALEWHCPKERHLITELLEQYGFRRVEDQIRRNDRGTMIFARPELIRASSDSNRPKVFLGIPVYGGMEPLFVNSLMGAALQLTKLKRKPLDLHIQMKAGDSLVPRARNALAAEFLKSDCTHFLQLDCDLIFGLDQIIRLVSHDELIVAGLYPMKKPELQWVANFKANEEEDERGLHRVRYAGTGCLLVKRVVLEKMIDALPDIAYGPDDSEHAAGHDFFSVGVHRGADGNTRYLSEDWYFCQRALDLGIDVFMDTRVVLKHIGQITYPLADPFATQEEAASQP